MPVNRRSFVTVLSGLAWLWSSPASARKQRELGYRSEQVWNAALRMVRVDLHLPVTDRDQEGGYLLFDYLSAGKRFPGSLELVAQAQGARPRTVVVAQVQGMPSYVEQMLLDRLEKKLLAEVGSPPDPPKEAPKPPPPPEAADDPKPDATR
jgi:hypothetical protein